MGAISLEHEYKLLAVEVFNFMTLKGAHRFEMDESGILNLCGYNDSGKSAFTRACEIIMYDAYPNEQVNYITDGESNFGIGFEFGNGADIISINKYKYSDGKSVWEMLRNDEVIFTNRLADGIAAMDGVPDPIKRYLGVIEDEATDSELNVRRNSDKLLLVDTSGGDNYKIINAILRCDVLAEVVRRLNEDRNKLQTEISSKATEMATLKNEYNSITVLDEDDILFLSQSYENLSANKTRLEYLFTIKEQSDFLNQISEPEEVSIVDTGRLQLVEEILSLSERLSIPVFEECSHTDISRLKALEEIKYLFASQDVVVPPEASTMDASRLAEIRSVGQAYNAYWHAVNEANRVIAEHEEAIAEMTKLSQIHNFKICKSCGTVVA